MVTHEKDKNYRHGIWHLDWTQKTNTRWHLPWRWSPTIPRMVTHQPKDGHPPEGSILQTRNLALRLNSQNKDQVTTAMDGHLPFLGWSPANPRMVTHRNEVDYRCGIWDIHLTHKTKTKWQLPWIVTYHYWMVTHQPKDGYPPEGHKLHTRNLAPRLNLQN